MGPNIRAAFLFDNDGVLIDSSDLHWRSWELFMEEEGSFSLSHEAFISCFGKRNDLIFQELAPGISPAQAKIWADRKEALFREMAKKSIALLPGMEDFLKEVQKANYPRIIASSTPVANLELFLSETVLGNYFDHFVSAEQVALGKPAPDVFLAAAEVLKFAPEDCIVIEDAPAGIQAGKAAGCFVVALGTTHDRRELRDYDLFFSSPSDLDLQKIISAFVEERDVRNSA